nr:hypothetical protein Iba_scaffold14838CG0020 [Ipomoea batatas]
MVRIPFSNLALILVIVTVFDLEPGNPLGIDSICYQQLGSLCTAGRYKPFATIASTATPALMSNCLYSYGSVWFLVSLTRVLRSCGRGLTLLRRGLSLFRRGSRGLLGFFRFMWNKFLGWHCYGEDSTLEPCPDFCHVTVFWSREILLEAIAYVTNN